MSNKTTISLALLAANERLLALRAQHTSLQQAAPPPSAPSADFSLTEVLAGLPPHLGWENETATRSVRGKAKLSKTAESAPVLEAVVPPAEVVASTLPLYPDLALAFLRQGRVADGRLWLLLRYLDEPGKGWVDGEEGKTAVTHPDSPLYFCGERQFYNLLRQGEGFFWRVAAKNGRIWLISLPKVAAKLGIEKFTGRAVELPLSALTSSIGTVRAHFYASFHSNRKAAPIARDTLQAMSGVSRRSQAAYERRVGVGVQPQIAIGERHTIEEEQLQTWQHGRASFCFQDKRGMVGQAGQSYHAWQLPNSYTGPHVALPKRRRQRLNRQLVDLRHLGDAGNGRKKAEGKRYSRRFYASGADAWRVWGRGGQAGGYWQNGRGQQRVGVWFALPDPASKPC